MRGADGDKYAGFSDFEAAQAVDDGHPMDAELFVELRGDFSHFGQGHGFVGLVIEVERGAIVGLIADEAIEGNEIFIQSHRIPMSRNYREEVIRRVVAGNLWDKIKFS